MKPKAYPGRVNEEQSPKTEISGEDVPAFSALDGLIESPPFVCVPLILDLLFSGAVRQGVAPLGADLSE